MTRILDRPVAARLADDGRVVGFRWRGRWEAVAEVLEEWVYRQPWWQQTIWGDSPDRQPERTVYRVLTQSGGVFEIAVDPDGRASVYRAYD